MLNLVCRDEALKSQVVDTVRQTFPKVYLQSIDEEVNEILYAVNCDKDTARDTADGSVDNARDIADASVDIAKYLNKCIKAGGAGASEEDFVEQMKNLKIL